MASRVSTGGGDCGFTLIELAVVIGLLAFLGIVSANTLFDASGWLAGYRLKTAARDLHQKMQKCRMSAIAENRDWAIVFDTDNNRYLICSHKGADGSWSSLADNDVTETVDLSRYKSGVSYGHGAANRSAAASSGAPPADGVSFNYNTAVFNAKGYASTNGYVYLNDGHSSAYAVGALTSGLFKIKKWTGNEWQ